MVAIDEEKLEAEESLKVSGFSDVEIVDLFASLANEPRLEEYLRSLMRKDIINYFGVSPDDDRARSAIKGGYMRTSAFIRQLRITRKELEELKKPNKKGTKIAGRYGS